MIRVAGRHGLEINLNRGQKGCCLQVFWSKQAARDMLVMSVEARKASDGTVKMQINGDRVFAASASVRAPQTKTHANRCDATRGHETVEPSREPAKITACCTEQVRRLPQWVAVGGSLTSPSGGHCGAFKGHSVLPSLRASILPMRRPDDRLGLQKRKLWSHSDSAVTRANGHAGSDVRYVLQSEGASQSRIELGIGLNIVRCMLRPKLDELPPVEPERRLGCLGQSGRSGCTHHGAC